MADLHTCIALTWIVSCFQMPSVIADTKMTAIPCRVHYMFFRAVSTPTRTTILCCPLMWAMHSLTGYSDLPPQCLQTRHRLGTLLVSRQPLGEAHRESQAVLLSRGPHGPWARSLIGAHQPPAAGVLPCCSLPSPYSCHLPPAGCYLQTSPTKVWAKDSLQPKSQILQELALTFHWQQQEARLWVSVSKFWERAQGSSFPFLQTPPPTSHPNCSITASYIWLRGGTRANSSFPQQKEKKIPQHFLPYKYTSKQAALSDYLVIFYTQSWIHMPTSQQVPWRMFLVLGCRTKGDSCTNLTFENLVPLKRKP